MWATRDNKILVTTLPPTTIARADKANEPFKNACDC